LGGSGSCSLSLKADQLRACRPRRRFGSTSGDDWLRSRGRGRKLGIEGLWAQMVGLGIPALDPAEQ